jgi:hypothetical protein
MPKVVRFFEDVAPRMDELMRRYDECRPKAVWTSISIGAQDVDPNLTEIIIRFDKPMIKTRYAIARTSSDQSRFPKLGKPQFDETGTVLRVPITLQPDHEYQFAIGSLVGAIHLQFRTKAMPERRSDRQMLDAHAIRIIREKATQPRNSPWSNSGLSSLSPYFKKKTIRRSAFVMAGRRTKQLQSKSSPARKTWKLWDLFLEGSNLSAILRAASILARPLG